MLLESAERCSIKASGIRSLHSVLNIYCNKPIHVCHWACLPRKKVNGMATLLYKN